MPSHGSNMCLSLFTGSVLCVGSEWHRFPSSFFVPSYVSEVRWIDDGFRGLLPFPFNSTLGGTAAAPPYFNNKNKASDEQYVIIFLSDDHIPSQVTIVWTERLNQLIFSQLHDIEACTFLVELDLKRPYPARGTDSSKWEVYFCFFMWKFLVFVCLLLQQ